MSIETDTIAMLAQHKTAADAALKEHLESVRAEVAAQRADVVATVKEHLTAMTLEVRNHRTAMDGALQPLSEAVDQNRREVQWATKRCVELAAQLEAQITMVQAALVRLNK